MTETSYSLMLRNLSSDYYHNHIDFEEYRNQRKKILDKIDQEMNGKLMQEQQQNVPESASIFMQAIGFIKNSEIEK
jgi:hypothetical protein